MEGKQTIGAIPATKIIPVRKLSSFGKKTLAAVMATIQAFGFKNLNKEAS